MENWNLSFVPECYFDTVLFKKILKTNKRLLHTRGCNNVVKRFMKIGNEIGSLYNKFGVGMVDKDKNELNFLKECKIIHEEKNLILWQHSERPHFIIQIKPPLELWLMTIAKECNLDIREFGYSIDPKILKKEIKNDIDSEENEKLNRFVFEFLKLNHTSILNLKTALTYFRDKNINADILELKALLN